MDRASPSLLAQVFVVAGIIFLLPRIVAVLVGLWAIGLLIEIVGYIASNWQIVLAALTLGGLVIGALIIRPVTMAIALALIGGMTFAEFRWLNSLG